MHIDAQTRRRGRARAVPINQLTLFDFDTTPHAEGDMAQAYDPALLTAVQPRSPSRREQDASTDANSYLIVAQSINHSRPQQTPPRPAESARLLALGTDDPGPDSTTAAACSGEQARPTGFAATSDRDTHLAHYLKSARMHDQHFLRLWRKLHEGGYDIYALLTAGIDAIADALSDNGQKNVRSTALTMCQAMRRMRRAHPEFGIPAPPEAPKVHLLPALSELPRTFRGEVEAYAKALGDKPKLSAKTRATDLRSPQEFMAAAVRAGVRPNDKFSICHLARPDVVTKTFAELGKSYSAKTASKIGYGFLRICREQLGDDHPDVRRLKDELATRYSSKALSAESLCQIERLLSSGIAKQLMMAPNAIMERAEQLRSRPQDQIARAGASVALALKMFDPSLAERSTAFFNVEVSLKWKQNHRCYTRPDLRRPEDDEWLLLDPIACAVLTRWEKLKKSLGDENPLLFPSLKGGQRTTSPVMAFIYSEIEAVIGQRLLWGNIKAMAAYAMLKQNPQNLLQAAEALGYRNVRSLELRMAPILNGGQA